MISRQSDQNRAGKTVLGALWKHRCVCWRLGGGLTCHYCAHQEKDAEEYVSRQRAEAVHDLPLGDGEENSKHLPTLKQSGPEPPGILTDRAARPYLRRTVEEPRGGSLRLRVGQLDRKLEAERQVARHEEPGHAGARDRGEESDNLVTAGSKDSPNSAPSLSDQ